MSVNRCSSRGFDRLFSVASRASFGLFFEMLTEALGFTPCRDEGKVTGLAAGGDPTRVSVASPFQLNDNHLSYTGPYGRRGISWVQDALIAKYSREDICAWAQHLLESNVTEIARRWIKKTGLTRLAVAGGIFANVKLNQRLHELSEVDELFVCPNMGDGGLSLGAICDQGGLEPQKISDVFLGDSYDADVVERALKRRDLSYCRFDKIDEEVARLLAKGNIVGRFTGRMEWGPRALGNRSILAKTSDSAICDRLNALLARNDFMPFAPACLEQDIETYCLNTSSARHAAEFMAVCFDCTERLKQFHPAVVHVDGTARMQIVRKETNPGFHRILKGYKHLTGEGVLLNTSFNIHEEPIVRTPEEAIDTFLRAGLDFLAIENYLVANKQESTRGDGRSGDSR